MTVQRETKAARRAGKTVQRDRKTARRIRAIVLSDRKNQKSRRSLIKANPGKRIRNRKLPERIRQRVKAREITAMVK
jgi:hypothetical protein